MNDKPPRVKMASEEACTLGIDELARRFATDVERGLTATEAARRLETDGPNELRAARPVPRWRRIVAQFQDPLIYLLLAAIAVAVLAWLAEGAHGRPVDALVIVVIVVANALIGYLQEARAESAVAALSRMTAVTSAVVRDGDILHLPSAQLVRGDLLLLSEGDAVGADARLVTSASLSAQEASLTGESEPVIKNSEPLAKAPPLGDRINMAFKGTAIVQGNGRAIVTATGMDTEMGAIAELLEATREEATPLQKEVTRIGRVLGAAVVVIALIVVATVMMLSEIRSIGDVVTVLLLGVSLAVAAVPEGLPAILTLVLAVGVQRMAQRNAIVKKLSSVEALGSASVICSDKTGTLTRSEMTIQRVITASGGSEVSGVGYAPEGRVAHPGGEPVSGAVLAEDIVVLSGGSIASSAALRQTPDGSWEIHGDPTEAAFLVAERKLGAEERRTGRFTRIREIPFSSDRKMMSTLAYDHEHGDQPIVVSKGAPDVLLRRCTRLRSGMQVIALDDETRRRVLADVDRLSDAALRTLAVAYRPLAAEELSAEDRAIERDLIFVGTVGMIDPPRPEAAQAIREAQRAGIRVVMITGDHPRTAARIAAELGLARDGAQSLTGTDLDRLDDAALAAAARTCPVYARVAPRHKLRIIDALQADGHIVAMTGDGVNDAPALKSADIGIAMGITGTEVTKQAARMILADDNFATIVAAVREGRAIFDNIRKFLRYLLSSNMGEVLTVFFGVVLAGAIGLGGDGGGLALPLLATQILWINLITDSGPALAMGVDPQTDDVMARPPRRLDERVIDARMWSGVIQTGIVMAVVTLLALDLYLPGGLIAGTRDLDNARTAAFNVLVFAQLFNALNARSETLSAFRQLFVNHWLWGAIALSVLLQVAVVNMGVLNVAFGTVPLTLDQWFACIALASLALWVAEARKWALRRAARGDRRP
ncbi:MAG TPA: cation-translocating P-type ATPase [Burkholderiales bacterium]|nr:cation-translocating P-type ATPase [Burkholderiales bacterium]